MIDQPEQRQQPRLHLDGTPVSIVDVESGVEFTGDGKNLSGKGLMFHSQLEPVVGADMHVTLESDELKALRASFRVVRVARRPEGGFEVAGRITRVH